MDPIEQLVNIVSQLRGPGGCPWDIEQTLTSLTPCIIEEAYELVDALESGNIDHIIEECGDVLLQVVMISCIANETNLFDLGNVATCVREKMIDRHPHVFGNKSIDTVDDVMVQWESIKDQKDKSVNVMDKIPALPALLKAEKIQKKASKQGFDWPDSEGAIDKVYEEFSELKDALKTLDQLDIEEEIGDLLFAMVNVCRKTNINAEEALRKANNKFISRYNLMADLDPNFLNLTLAEKETLWQQAKKIRKIQ